MTDAPHAEDAARHRDDVVRGPALGLVDREDAGERLVQAIPSATGGVARAAASASRAARSTASRTAARSPLTSAPAARTWPPPPKRAMTADASTEGAHADVRHETLTAAASCSLNNSAIRIPF